MASAVVIEPMIAENFNSESAVIGSVLAPTAGGYTEWQSIASSINHAGTLTLPQAINYAAAGVYNVLAYGAVADADGAGGGTDNAAAIQAAITAAGSGIVYLPPGGYKVETSLDLTSLAAGITLRGDARESTVLYWHAAGGNVLDLTGSQYVKIENLTITAGYFADAGVNYYADCGILMGRKAGAGSAGNHIVRDVHLNNYFRKAGIYSLSSEVNHFDNIHIYQRYAAACYHHSDTNDLTAASEYETLTALAGNATTTTIIGGSWTNWSPTGGGLAYIKNTTGLTINGLGLQTDGTPAAGAITFVGAVNNVCLTGVRQEGTPDYGIHIKTSGSVLNQVTILACYFTAATALIYGDAGTTMQYSTVLGTFNTGVVEQINGATVNGCLIDTLGLTATVRTAALNNIWLNAREDEPDITGGIGNVRFSQWAAGNPRWVENMGGVFASNLGWGIRATASGAANTLGDVVRKVAVYDEASNILGYVALYDAITQV